ncbi:Outward rectifying potassium channel [Zostera marina]|uniref:Outward rectifying potassium channel n=1 Tax=Zostera marina TaxID=29655 RepID=A0A0K9PTW7_ZOSMR|nr:Outward rectifying potassium channel [Zostera marina]
MDNGGALLPISKKNDGEKNTCFNTNFCNTTVEEDDDEEAAKDLATPLLKPPAISSSDGVDGADPSKDSISSSDSAAQVLPKGNSSLHRSRTAPAMANIDEVIAANNEKISSLVGWKKSGNSVRLALLYLTLYLAAGVVIYIIGRENFTSEETHSLVDALYFSVVTMCTIGYGDITPKSPFGKLFSIAFVLIGFGFIDIFLSGTVAYVLDLQESILLSAVVAARESVGKRDVGSYLVDIKKGRMRIRMKVTIALSVVVLCVGVGTAFLHFVEMLGWLDSFYLSVMSVTTVGYGDHAFNTMSGRLFASVWLLVSTLAVARAFIYLAEARIDKRHRAIAKLVLGRGMTVSEFFQADIDQNGVVSKSEFVVSKLKEMGKISDKDIHQICVEFNKLDTSNRGKITLKNLLDR